MKLNDVVITIGDTEIKAESMEFEAEIETDNKFRDIDLTGYSGEVTITSGYIETPKQDDRIGSRVLPKYFKNITLGKDVYGRISRSLDKLGVRK